jgi:SAM-dependent methyltransferase
MSSRRGESECPASSKQALVASLRAVFADWESLLAEKTEAAVCAPLRPGGWSIGGYLTHLFAWQQISVARMEAALRDTEPDYPAWLGGADPFHAEEHTGEFNARIQAAHAGRSWPERYRDWRAGFLRCIELAEAIPPALLADKDRFAWLKGHALAAVLEGTCEHHREHLEHLAPRRDRWASAASYEAFMGRWSRLLAPQFLAWLGLPAGLDWLDVGCGTGALSAAICQHAAPASVLGCDPAAPFVEAAREQVTDPRASFAVAGVGSLPSRPGGYGSISSLLVLNFIPDPAAAVAEMRGLAAPGATVAACVWDYGGKMGFLRRFWDAAAALEPAQRALDEGQRFVHCHPDALTALFLAAGLGEVQCEGLELPTVFADFADYWQPLLGGTGPVPSYVASLSAERRQALAARLEETLPRDPAGRIVMSARAWAVRGVALAAGS